MTNRDKINKMTNKEFAKAILGIAMTYNFEHKGGISDKNGGVIFTGVSFDIKKVLENGLEEGVIAIAKWLDTEIEFTADDMFAELGYIKENEEPFVRYHKVDGVEERIFINNDYSYSKTNKMNTIPRITEAEDKAIHKKIEELKNGLK